jgi:alcohol dehydrogenase
VAVKAAGAGFVMVTGAGPRDEPRLALARRLGAAQTVDVAVDETIAAQRGATGGGADVVVDVTAKAPDALEQAVGLARPGGTVVVAGTRGAGASPGIDADLVVFKELRVLGALGVDATAYDAALALLAAGDAYGELPHEVVGFDGAASLLASLAGETDGMPPVHGVITPPS